MTKGDNATFLNEFIEADNKARHLERDLQTQFIHDRDVIQDLEQKQDNLQLSIVELKRQIVELQKTQTILKRKMSENEDKYHDTVLYLEAKAKENENVVEQLRTTLMMQPQSKRKMDNKFKDPIAIKKKQNVRIIDYNKLNALYEDFVPQKELSAEQKYFSSTLYLLKILQMRVVQIVMWIVDSFYSKYMTGDHSLLKNFVEKFMGTVRFRNDHFAAITGYGDYIQGNMSPLSLSFDFGLFSSEIFKSLSFRLDRLCHLTILCLDQHAHTLHHLESLLTISLDRLDIFEGRSCISEFVRKSLSLILELS
ncbi:hypothetical protein Tco_0368867 [Tanacetum coccineum]